MPRVVHFEIHADEPERAVKFYGDAFGWTFDKWDGPIDYWLVMTGDTKEPGIDGGLMQRQGPGPEGKIPVSSYVCTVDVPSYDEYAQKIVEAGGVNVVEKMAVEKVGWMGYFKDTEGNTFGIMESDESAK